MNSILEPVDSKEYDALKAEETFVEATKKRYGDRDQKHTVKIAIVEFYDGFKEDAVKRNCFVILCNDRFFHLTWMESENNCYLPTFTCGLEENLRSVLGEITLGQTGMKADDMLREGYSLIKMMNDANDFSQKRFIDQVCFMATGIRFSNVWDRRSEPCFFDSGSLESPSSRETEPKGWCRFM